MTIEFLEHDLQRAVALYLDLKGFRWTHVANERKTSPRRGYRLKQAGVKRGVPDILIFAPFEDSGVMRPGIAIELKSDKGRITKEQREWLDDLDSQGWKTAVCRDLDSVIALCDLLDKPH